LRIIGGTFRSRKINMVNSDSTRSTSDMVRLAVFNMIDIKVSVLDLFGGTGAYALESISRGSLKAYINDSNILAYNTIISNVKLLKVEQNTIITDLDYRICLNKYLQDNITFGLIFLDPPYEMNLTNDDVNNIINILDDDGLIILERKIDTPSFNNSRLELLKEKKYGIKKIYIYKKMLK